MEALELVNQYLTFKLDTDVFAVDVGKAREVLDFVDVTRVPQTPDYMLGVINLRGSVVPVIDMRRKFGMVAADLTRNSCIVVVEVDVDGDAITVGAELVGASDDTLNIRVNSRPQTRTEALALAREQYEFCPDIVDKCLGDLSSLAAMLMEEDWWFFWWD